MGTKKRYSKNTGQTKKKKITKSQKGRKSTRQNRMRTLCRLGIILLLVLTAVLVSKSCINRMKSYRENTGAEIDASKPEIDVQLLDVNEYSRPGIESNRITGIVIHYTANPGATAQNNRDYFQGLMNTHETKVSSHFIVGLEGEIIQCVPTWEIAYASNDRNADTVSIECCHPDETGKFTDATYQSVIQLTAWLCKKFDLDEEAVIRHYDVTGKNCPKYYVENEDAWLQFKADVKRALEEGENQR